MICPQCGPRDVVASSNAERGVHFCECDNCGHHWEEPYDPTNTIKPTERKETDASK